MSHQPSPTQPNTLISAQTATTASGIMLLYGQCARLTVVVQGAGTIDAGAVTIEEAYYDPNGPVYAGTWSVIGSPIAGTSVTGGKQLVTHVVGSFWAVRVRISTTVTGSGGAVTVVAWGN